MARFKLTPANIPTDEMGRRLPVVAAVSFDPSTGASGSSSNATYTLASNQTVNANSGTTQVDNVQGGSYVFDAQFTGTSIRLESLGADGATWRTVVSVTQSGTQGVVLGQGASVRLYNPNGTNDTAVSASLT